MHVRKGDTVVVVTGKEKGKRGKVLRILTKKDRVLVERVNMVKRHTKPSQKHPQGGIIEKEGSIEISNLQIYCPKCDAPRRTGVKVREDGKKQRTCRKCGEVFEAAER
ncbi:MAG TPA: 50S ribosomal protein L24 [Polyangia bacterium]|jgi:large subunit ribosomal protein L24